MQALTSLGAPDFSVCSMTTTTRRTPATRSMAPPMPLTILPGTIQFARSPASDTCIAPSTDRLMWPPRIMAKLSADEKYEDDGSSVIVCLPALIRSASASPSYGNGPIPSMPFSLCSVTSTPGGM